MSRLAVLPISFDHPHIFVLDALAAGRPNHPQEHGFLRNLSLGYQQTNQFVATAATESDAGQHHRG